MPPIDPAVLRKMVLTCDPECPEHISRTEAAGVLDLSPDEMARVFGDTPYLRTASVRAHIAKQQRDLLQAPEKQTVVVVWPRAHE